MFKIFILSFALVILAVPAQAAKCYSPAEAEAEQAIRIHSELMVIGLNCQHLGPRDRKNLYTQYKDFTQRHGALLRGYENTLINYFRQAGSKNPEREIHNMRTNFANKTAKDVATMRPDGFCAYYAPRIPRANAMNGEQVRSWAATFFPNFSTSKSICK